MIGAGVTLPPVAASTGERVTTAEGGFNLSFQRHRAEYRMCAQLLGPGRVLDLACGTGHSYAELAPRETVGIDIEPSALAGQDRETHVADMRSLPFPADSFRSVVAIHAIEHVREADQVLEEVARVLAPGGRAVFATPNRLTFSRPDEIIDPYHYVEYDARELLELCAPHFDSVEIIGVEVSARYRAIHDAERRELDHLLGLDLLRLRRFVPRRIRQRLYDWRLSRDRAVPRRGETEIEPGDFWLSRSGLEQAIDLLAVCDAH